MSYLLVAISLRLLRNANANTHTVVPSLHCTAGNLTRARRWND